MRRKIPPGHWALVSRVVERPKPVDLDKIAERVARRVLQRHIYGCDKTPDRGTLQALCR